MSNFNVKAKKPICPKINYNSLIVPRKELLLLLQATLKELPSINMQQILYAKSNYKL